MREFKSNFRGSKKNECGLLFDEIDKDSGTKDKVVIVDKLNMLKNLMIEFLHTNEKENNVESFIADNLKLSIKEIQEELEFYNESLDLLLENTVRLDSKIRNDNNRFSLLAMIAYSYKEDIDLDEWMTEYAKNNNTYFTDQRKNYLHMREDLERFIKNKKKSA